MNSKPQIVFFGTGPVSLSCLEGIYDTFAIEAIVTKPDRVAPSGRAHEHPVREWAQTQKVPVHQVADKAALQRLVVGAGFASRVGLVVDFGMIIPATVIDSFELGIINSHFSLLPLLRGADPISFAILEGQEETGVSLMQIVPTLDEGPLIAQESYRLPADVTTPRLTQELSDISSSLLREYLPKYIIGDIIPWPQDGTVAPSYTRRLTKRDGDMDWKRPAVELERQLRALVGWPGSRTRLFGRDVIVTQARVVAKDAESWPDRLLMPCGGGSMLEILKLKPAGKREMAAADFLRGLSGEAKFTQQTPFKS